jgi:hypothetical protein
MKGGDSPLEPSTSGSWGKIRGAARENRGQTGRFDRHSVGARPAGLIKIGDTPKRCDQGEYQPQNIVEMASKKALHKDAFSGKIEF